MRMLQPGIVLYEEPYLMNNSIGLITKDLSDQSEEVCLDPLQVYNLQLQEIITFFYFFLIISITYMLFKLRSKTEFRIVYLTVTYPCDI